VEQFSAMFFRKVGQCMVTLSQIPALVRLGIICEHS